MSRQPRGKELMTILESGLVDNRPYYQKVIDALGAKILQYHLENEDVGASVAIDYGPRHTNCNYGGTRTLGQPGIGDGLTACKYVNVANSGINLFPASPINMAEGFWHRWISLDDVVYWTDATTYQFINLSSDATHGVFGRKTAADGLQAYRRVAAAIPGFNLGVPTTTRYVGVGFVWSVAQGKLWSYINGARNITVSATLDAMVDTIASPSVEPRGWPGNCAHLLIGTGLPTDAEMRVVGDITKQVAFDGDSRTAGKWWAERAMEAAYPDGVRCYGGRGLANWAVSGNTVANLISLAAAGVDTIVNPGGSNTLVVWAGVNSAAVGAATIYSQLQTYIAARRAAGWNKIILCSEIDAQSSMTWHNTVWPALNVLLAADHSFADGFIDLGGDARLQNALDTTYYLADKVHLTAAGYAVVGELAAPVIAAVAA